MKFTLISMFWVSLLIIRCETLNKAKWMNLSWDFWNINFPILQISFHAPHYVHAFPLSNIVRFQRWWLHSGKSKEWGLQNNSETVYEKLCVIKMQCICAVKLINQNRGGTASLFSGSVFICMRQWMSKILKLCR